MKHFFLNHLHRVAVAEGTGGNDIEIKSSADLLKALTQTKESLETGMESKAKEIFDAQIKAVNEKIEAVKGLPADITGDVLKQMQKDLQTTIDDFDKWQVKMNAFVINGAKGQKTSEPEFKTFNDRLAEAIEENHDNVQKFIKGETKRLNIELKAVGAVSTGNVTGSTNWGAANDGKFIMNPSNLMHIRDFIPTRSYGPATDYYFMRENGAGEGAPAPVAEGATKPQIDIDLVETSVKFEYIAAWMLMSRKAMLNIPGFIGFLQARLPQRLLDVEDQQILYGTGTSPQIKGIGTSGNFVASTSTITNKLIKKIIDDITLLEGTYKRKANGILLSPAQFAELLTNTASGSGEFDLPPGVTFVNGQLSIWGVPVQKVNQLTSPDYFVGDFVNGAELLIQEAMNLQFFEQDSTNVRTNQVTVRIEEAVALPVYSGDMFIKGTSATS